MSDIDTQILTAEDETGKNLLKRWNSWFNGPAWKLGFDFGMIHTSHRRQVFSSLGVLASVICFGITTHFPTVFFFASARDSIVRLSNDNAGSFLFIVMIPIIIGPVISGILMDRIGRKAVIMIASILFFFGWLSFTISFFLHHLFVGRILTGLAFGILAPAVCVFLAETTSPEYRATFLSLISPMIMCGVAILYFFDRHFPWRISALLSTIFPIITFGIMLFVPESPTFLTITGDYSSAELSYRWFHANYTTTTPDLDQLIARYRQNPEILENQVWVKTKIIFKTVVWWVILSVFAMSQLTASSYLLTNVVYEGVFLVFLRDIYIIVCFIRVISACVIAGTLFKKYNLRTLGLWSCVGSGVIFMLNGLDEMFDLHIAFKHKDLIQLFGFGFHVLVVSIPLLAIPWIVIGEIMPSHLRAQSVGICLSMFFVYIMIDTGLEIYFFSMHPEKSFFIFGVISILIGLFIYKFLPETTGKSLEQIEDMFSGQNVLDGITVTQLANNTAEV